MRKATTTLCSLSLLAMSFGGANTVFASETARTPGAAGAIAVDTGSDTVGKPAAALADAQIASLKGAETRVNQGEGYAPAASGMLLKVGDSLFAGAESQIVITYLKEGCSQTIPSESVARVEAVAPCLKSSTSLGAQAMSIPAEQAGTIITPAVAGAPGFCANPLQCAAVAGLATAAVTVGIIALTSEDDDDDDDPASPD